MQNAQLALTQYRLIEVAGIDAEKFLQGQLSCDVAKLEVGANTICAHCDPKGKISGLFRLFRMADERFLLLARAELLPEALDQLKKYAVFSKVSFQILDWQLVGLMGADLAEKSGAFSASFLTLADGRAIGCNLDAQELDFNAEASLWDWFDIKYGVPILHAPSRLEYLPQALNLQALEQAISFQKGCYIGQEMVARAKYRGANKRAMYCLTADSQNQPAIGSEIEMQLEQNWRKTGTILSALSMDGKLWLQVVMSNQLEANQAFRLPTGEPLQLQALPYELS